MEGGTGGQVTLFPKYRKQLYTEFKFCERFGINPFEFLKSDLSSEDRLLALAYEQVRQHEEHEDKLNLYKLQGHKV